MKYYIYHVHLSWFVLGSLVRNVLCLAAPGVSLLGALRHVHIPGGGWAVYESCTPLLLKNGTSAIKPSACRWVAQIWRWRVTVECS